MKYTCRNTELYKYSILIKPSKHAYRNVYRRSKWNRWLEFKFLDESVCVSLPANSFEKDMNPPLISPVMGK